MRRIVPFLLCLVLLLAGCGQQTAKPPLPESPAIDSVPAETISEPEPEATETGLDIVLPEEHLDALIVTRDFPDAASDSHQIPLIRVQERASAYGKTERKFVRLGHG